MAADKSQGTGAVSKEQAKDTGMALVLLALIVHLATGQRGYLTLAVALLVINMVWPRIYAWPARGWLGLSHALGTVMSKVVLTLVFFIVVTPVGLLRRAMGKDTLQLKNFKKDGSSAFVVREHTYAKSDVERPF